MSVSLFVAIVALIVIATVLSTAAMLFTLTWYYNYMMAKQPAMLEGVFGLKNDKSLDEHFDETPEPSYYNPKH